MAHQSAWAGNGYYWYNFEFIRRANARRDGERCSGGAKSVSQSQVSFNEILCYCVVEQIGFENKKGSSHKLFPRQPHRHLLCFLGTWGRRQDSGRTRTTRQESFHQRGECSSWQGFWFINLFLVDSQIFKLGWKRIWLLELAWFQLGCCWRSEIGGVGK